LLTVSFSDTEVVAPALSGESPAADLRVADGLICGSQMV
jgi:hypothetical protein